MALSNAFNQGDCCLLYRLLWNDRFGEVGSKVDTVSQGMVSGVIWDIFICVDCSGIIVVKAA